jgi:class 3 adenylate cyclase
MQKVVGSSPIIRSLTEAAHGWDNRGVARCLTCGGALPSGARFCPACAAPVAEEAPSEERKLATVLFADLVGSTDLADLQDAERTRALLNRFYDAMAEQIVAAGGTLEKFIGDAVMAAFGAPAAQEDHADRALDAALSMQRTLRSMFGDVLKLRIGVNAGEVVVGQARAGGSFVTGDAVNVAARLEQAAAPGEIMVGARTAAAVRKRFVFDNAMTVSAKGKAAGCPAVGCSKGLRTGGRISALSVARSSAVSRSLRRSGPHTPPSLTLGGRASSPWSESRESGRRRSWPNCGAGSPDGRPSRSAASAAVRRTVRETPTGPLERSFAST